MGKFKTALGRQVGEAIRIQMRGNTLNSTGVYNRCRLTRLVIDSQWDKKVWEESWQSASKEQEHLKKLADQQLTGEEEFEQRGEKRREGTEPEKKAKRRRINDYEEGFLWGETAKEDDLKREEFLHVN